MTSAPRNPAYRPLASNRPPLQPAHLRDVTLSPLEPRVLPPGFHRYELPSLDRERTAVIRNWRRTGKVMGRQHVVVMEGDPRILEMLGCLLDDAGYDVTLSSHFLDPEDIGRIRADLIIADASFNRGDGGLCLYPLSPAAWNGAPIPIVYSTTMPMIASRLAGIGVHALLKPYELDELLGIIAQDIHAGFLPER